jgi:predicted metal-dependent peptidase
LDEPVLVYDLEIEGEHNYMANGVVVHNSISDDMLKLFFNEIRWVWKNGAVITVYEADCAICRQYKFKGRWNGKVHGRGGTDLEPVLKEVEGRYDALIYFTDFYAPEIKTRYNIPVLWVLTTELEKSSYPYKWGRHIKIEDGKAVAA